MCVGVGWLLCCLVKASMITVFCFTFFIIFLMNDQWDYFLLVVCFFASFGWAFHEAWLVFYWTDFLWRV